MPGHTGKVETDEHYAARGYGKIGGVRIKFEEVELLDRLAAKLGTSRTRTIVAGLNALKQHLKANPDVDQAWDELGVVPAGETKAKHKKKAGK